MGCKSSAKRSLFYSNRKRKFYTDQEDGAVEINHPKDLSKSPAAAGFFVSPTFDLKNPYIIM
jgi:hypothetical protein